MGYIDKEHQSHIDDGNITKRTDEELLILFSKFDNDMKKRSRFFRLLLVLDQMLNVIILNGSQDETMSSHIRRRIKANKATRLERGLCWLLRKIEDEHCRKSLGE